MVMAEFFTKGSIEYSYFSLATGGAVEADRDMVIGY